MGVEDIDEDTPPQPPLKLPVSVPAPGKLDAIFGDLGITSQSKPASAAVGSTLVASVSALSASQAQKADFFMKPEDEAFLSGVGSTHHVPKSSAISASALPSSVPSPLDALFGDHGPGAAMISKAPQQQAQCDNLLSFDQPAATSKVVTSIDSAFERLENVLGTNGLQSKKQQGIGEIQKNVFIPTRAMLGRMDFYDILGVTKFSATESEIQREYKKKALLLHPDKRNKADHVGREEMADDYFKAMTKAYETLSDADLRREYDGLLKHENAPSIDSCWHSKIS